jgi:hypothetical protein
VEKGELAKAIERGEYEIDPHAVAEAMLRSQWASTRLGRVRSRPSMLESGKPLDSPPVGIEQDEPAAGADLA